MSMDSEWVPTGLMAVAGTIGGGALLAGFIFAKLTSVGWSQLFSRSIFFVIAIASLHLIISFVYFRGLDAVLR